MGHNFGQKSSESIKKPLLENPTELTDSHISSRKFEKHDRNFKRSGVLFVDD